MTGDHDSTDAPRLFLEGRVHPNKTALQFYVSSDTAQERAFPFGPDDEYRGMTLQGTEAVLVWPKGRPPAFPLEVEGYRDERVPWPLEPLDDAPSPPKQD